MPNIIETTYGTVPPAGVPDGFSKRIVFPELMWLDQWTPDNRRIESSGFGQPYLPATVKFLEVDGPGGHQGAVAAGRLDQVTVHADGRVSGVGFAERSAAGDRMVQALQNRTVKGNSVDLRDTEMKVKFPSWEEIFPEPDEEGFETIPKIQVSFSQARLGATTVCMEPAFGTANAVVLEDGDQITASLGYWRVSDEAPAEFTASATDLKVPWEDFHRPESPTPQPITIDEHGVITGHLGKWGSCHQGFLEQCVMIPHSATNYASYMKPGAVLTDRGLIAAGSLFAYKGHPTIRDPRKINEAYGGLENTWGHVRITDGRFGPWISGRVMPGVRPETVYAARGARISGHWFSGELKAIVSVNLEGYEVTPEVSYGTTDQGTWLAASFAIDCNCEDPKPVDDAAEGFDALEHVALLDSDADEFADA